MVKKVKNSGVVCCVYTRKRNLGKVDFILLSIINKMQRYTVFFITVNALHISGGFSAHHQELKNCKHSMGYMPSLLVATASVGELELTHASGSNKQTWHVPHAVCTVFELLMMGGETA
jgi:hypothetical protein